MASAPLRRSLRLAAASVPHSYYSSSSNSSCGHSTVSPPIISVSTVIPAADPPADPPTPSDSRDHSSVELSPPPTDSRETTVPPSITMALEVPDMLRMFQFSLANNITKLNGSNFAKWKHDMEIHLHGADLWSFVTDDPPAAPDRLYSQRLSAALQDIYISCEPDQQSLIMNFTSAKACWTFLYSK